MTKTKEIQDYLTYLFNRGHRPTSLKTIGKDLDLFVRFLKEQKKEILKVDPVDIEAYLEKIKPTISDHTYYHRFSTIRCFYRYLERELLICYNPAAAIEGIKTPGKLPKVVPNEKEVDEFLGKPRLCTAYGIRDRAIFELFYSAGLRNQELRDLKLEDVDLAQRVATVREGKGGKGRIVPFGRKAREAIEVYLTKVRPTLQKKPTHYLFLTDRGNPISQHMLRYTMNRYRDPENRTSTPHTLRHAFALHMLRKGASIVHLQRLLGHDRITTTTVYTRLNPEDLKKAVKKYHPRELAAE